MHVHGEVVEALGRLAAVARKRHPDDPLLPEFVLRYYAELPEPDIDERTLDDAYAAAYAHYSFGRRRTLGQTKVKVISPDRERDGWQTNRSLLMIVTEDAPFLVDTVRMVLDRHRSGIHLIVHPILEITRDGDGQLIALDSPEARAEAWTLVEIDRCLDDTVGTAIEAEVHAAVAGVQSAVDDFAPMAERMAALADAVGGEEGELLQWLVDRHFVFLGSASYDDGDDGELAVIEGSQLGQLRAPHGIDPPLQAVAGAVSIARSTAESTIHRASRQTCVTITLDGRVHRFVGLLALSSYRVSVMEIPLVRQRAEALLGLIGGPYDSHSARSVRNVIESLPRDVVLELDADAVADLVIDIVGLQERPIVRVFAVPEPVGEWETVLVYLPRTRFSAELLPQVAEAVAAMYGGEYRDLDSLVGTSLLARITVTVHRPHNGEPDLEALERIIDELSISWEDRFKAAVVHDLGEGAGRRLIERVTGAVSDGYRAAVEPAQAVADLGHVIDLVDAGAEFSTSIGRAIDAPDGEWRFRVYRRGKSATLSELLPLLDRLGLTVLDERPHLFHLDDGQRIHLYDIGVSLPRGVILDEARRHELQASFEALLRGEIEGDGFNRLVLLAGLSARQVAVLRTYARYLRQMRLAFSDAYVQSTICAQPQIAAGLAELFDTRFTPGIDDRDERVANIRARLGQQLDDVPSLDEDRICRAFLTLIEATTRTNAFRHAGDDPRQGWRPVIAVKFDPQQLPDLPQPRPMFEIFVCSPRVEGVHLRGGPIARGGLRWSDRREDFRTEVLGLAKAQMVKNSVIVPVGAKGGFVLKQIPASPEQLRAEGEGCYRAFVGGLLDVTDNIVDGEVVHPPSTVVYDGDDPYLVVAADKGTATFSDVANEVAGHYGFWLGDAFASGGSEGYDHKAMGITARGAWESVRRHARVLGKDADTHPLTVVGIGDMSGDVFGNGMLRSPHLRLVAAFDHRHIFLDPNPDPATAFGERKRLYELQRSSWADYERPLISAGGGVYPRTLKTIEISPEAQEAIGVKHGRFTPAELIAAILRAPVDLLWNGGIGTYVKASNETHADVGDRANDAVRVDGNELRCRMVGEGGNLGLTQRARVEFSLGGGLIYTDAIDNSAGVDCSDHEVNIKILLDGIVAAGDLTRKQRHDLLTEMTDEVAELVLDTNRGQTLALMIARRQASPMVNVHARYLTLLEDEGWLDRALEFLPTDKQIADRQAQGQALQTPEFAVMIAYTKNANVVEAIASDLPDEPVLERDLFEYFPTPLRERFPEAIRAHRLHREIIATTIINQMVNMSGISYDNRMTEDTGASVVDVIRSWVAARELFDFEPIWNEIEALGTTVSLDTQLDMFLNARRMVERGSLWMLRHRSPPLDISGAVDHFASGISMLLGSLGAALAGRMRTRIKRSIHTLEQAGVPTGLAGRAGVWPLMHTGFDIVELAEGCGCTLGEAASVYWTMFDELELGWLWDGVGALPRSDRWQTQARSALRDDLLTVLADLARAVLRSKGTVRQWLTINERAALRATNMLTQIRRAESFDLTNLSVALRQLRNLALSSIDA